MKPLARPSTHAFALAGLLLLTGCAARRVAYQTPVSPQLQKSATWSTQPAGGATASPADDRTLSRWWATLGDPELTSLEERAIQANLDLRKAESKIRQAQAQLEVARTDRNVTGTISSSGTGSRSSTRTGGNLGQNYAGSFQASWEPDFFSRIRSSIAAYSIDVEAAQEDLRNTLVSLTAEVALNYIDVRSYQKQLAVTRENLAKQEDTYRLTVAKYDSGLATRLDVEQASQNLESTRAGIPSLETSIQKSANAIAVLLGERPGAIDAELAEVKPIPVIPVSVAVGIPADLLRRRPDIRSAERQVAAQTARVGAAVANLYPSFSLSSTFSLSSFDVLNFLAPASLAGNLVGSAQRTVLNRRKLREQVKVEDAALEQSVTNYESTVLNAIEDVENALKAFAAEQERRKSLAEATAAAERAAEMSRSLYGSGLKDFLSVIDAERSLLTLQNQLAQSDATITANLARLYKALGGGWN